MDMTALINNSNCALCTLGPPPDMILRLPPPPIPSFLQQGSEFLTDSEAIIFRPHHNDSPCKHFCNWRSEGVQYVEMPQQGNIIFVCLFITYFLSLLLNIYIIKY